jgi:dihydroxy-acid dehydratase
MGDGRQSGTSASPSILNASPESFAGGGLVRLRTGDRVRVDLPARRVDALVPDDEWERRGREPLAEPAPAATPWQQLYRTYTGQLHTGGCLDFACDYREVCGNVPRHNH